MACLKKWALLFVLACSGNGASATEEFVWSEGFKLAGEIVVVPSGTAVKSTATGASDNRKSARAIRDPAASKTQTIIIVPEDEEGVLSPSMVPAPADNRSKARDYSRGTDSNGSTTVIIVPEDSGAETDRGRSLSRNRSKARRYSDDGAGVSTQTGSVVKIGTAVGIMGADGVVVYACDDVNNAAGRIGDDSQAGNVFTVMVGSKQVRARCK